MDGFNKPKNINDSNVFQSKAGMMMRNAALFQTSGEVKEVAGKKDYFQYDEDGSLIGMRYTSQDNNREGGGYFTPKEISAKYAQNKEGALYDEREDGTNKFSDHRGGLVYADDDKEIIRGYRTDDGKFHKFKNDGGGDYLRSRREFKGRNLRELESFERKYNEFNRRRANDRENFRRMAEYAESSGKLSRKPSERYIPWEEKKKLMGKKDK